MADILPCECGGAAHDVPDSQHQWAVQCERCVASVTAATQNEAIDAWNRSRAPAPATPQGVETAIDSLAESRFWITEHWPDRLAALRAAIAAHAASEVEAAIEELAQWFDDGADDAGWHDGAEVAAAIRARKDATNG